MLQLEHEQIEKDQTDAFQSMQSEMKMLIELKKANVVE